MTTNHKPLVDFAKQLQHIHNFADNLFIGRQTSLAQSVIIWLAINHLGEDRSPLKTAHLSLTYSESAIRRYLRQLEQHHWLKFNQHLSDGRYRELILTDKFIETFTSYYLHVQKSMTLEHLGTQHYK